MFVLDDTSFNTGVISNGWLLALTTATPIVGNADVGITMTANPTSTIVTSNVTYTVTVNNYGPAAASNIVVTDPIPAGMLYAGSSASLGTAATNAAGALNWSISSLPNGGYAFLTLVLEPMSAGQFTNAASVASGSLDLNPDDDTASAGITVTQPTADLAIALSGAPSPVLVGGSLTYSMTVSNLGPATASGVSITNSLPAGVTFVSAAPSGYVLIGNSVVFTNLGNLGSGGQLFASIVVRPTIGATLTDSANCASSIPDPRKLNNSASVKTVVEAVLMGLTQSGNSLVISWTPDASGYSLSRPRISPRRWSGVPSPTRRRSCRMD